VQVRRGSAIEWTAANPILMVGELGVELDTGQWKLGDGVTAWNTLDYAYGGIGPQGPEGIQGITGEQGIPGEQGIQGEQGIPGITGDQGVDGIQGIAGGLIIDPNHIFVDNAARDAYFVANPAELITGIYVSSGTDFQQWDGAAWINKTLIITGPRGLQGIPGIDGEQGIQGIQGIPGEQGIQGVTGLTGLTGADSIVVGPIGPEGPEGPEGPAGADSLVAGPDGPIGPVGLDGIQGPIGPQGIPGVEGVKTVVFCLTGALTVGTNKIGWLATGAHTITKIKIYSSTIPTGADIIADIHKNGVTLFTTQANRPTVIAGTNLGADRINMDIATVVENDYVNLDIDQIGSTIAGGNNLIVELVIV